MAECLVYSMGFTLVKDAQFDFRWQYKTKQKINLAERPTVATPCGAAESAFSQHLQEVPDCVRHSHWEETSVQISSVSPDNLPDDWSVHLK